MTDTADSETTEDGGDDGLPTLAWETPEIAAIVVLIAFAVLVLGGLIGDIIASAAASGPVPTPRQYTGAAITLGAAWAGPPLAIALLAVVGLCWWQTEAWDEARAEPDPHGDQAQGHIERARLIGRLAQVALFLTAAGSMAALTGTVIGGVGNNAWNWSRYVIEGASFAAVVAISAGGWWIDRRARERQLAPPT